MKTIRVAVYRPQQEVAFEDLRNDLQSMQKLVGGYIEAVYMNEALLVVCNEEGKLEGLPANRIITRPGCSPDMVVGTFFVCRKRGGDFASIREEDEDVLKRWKPGYEWEVV